MASMGMPPGAMGQQPPGIPHPQMHQVQVGVGVVPVPGHPQAQSHLSHHQQQQPPPPQQQQQQQQQDIDPITKFKALLPQLKESLVNLFKIGGHQFYQNSNQDENGVHIDKVSGRFEETMEYFYATCDQIEAQLRLAQEIVQQDKDSRTNTPVSVAQPKTDPGQPEGQLYSQYISTVRAQITCAKDIKDLLHNGLNNFQDHSHP